MPLPLFFSATTNRESHIFPPGTDRKKTRIFWENQCPLLTNASTNGTGGFGGI